MKKLGIWKYVVSFTALKEKKMCHTDGTKVESRQAFVQAFLIIVSMSHYTTYTTNT